MIKFILALALCATLAAAAQAHGRCKHDKYGRDICPKVYNWKGEFDCKGPVRAVGSQWVGAEGAKSSAIKAWREIVRFDSGEKFSDWANAKDVEQGCSRSSIGEVVGKVLYRCVVTAVPCKMKLTNDGR